MKKIAFELIIESELSEIPKVIHHFETFANDNKLEKKLVSMTSIAFDELLNNTITYGYGTDPQTHEISVGVKIHLNRLTITIKDDGTPFNPFIKSPPDTTKPLDERQIGGLGIHIVKTIMDEVNYERVDNKNQITLVKNNIAQ